MKRFAWAAVAVLAVLTLGSLWWCAGIDVSALPARRDAVTFEDRSGAALGTIWGSDRGGAVFIALDRVSPWFTRAVVDAEDARFYMHGPIDIPAVARAAREYVVYGRSRSGASTIDMQLARLITPGPSITIRGKIEQMVLAARIDARSSKTATLAAYVNRVPMGGELYGIEAAARTYFGEPASALDLAQASLLAAIPNDPSRLNPYAHWDALRERQRYVLERMTSCGDITPRQAQLAFSEMLHVRPEGADALIAPHALYALFPTVAADTARVRTTIDADLQRFVVAQIRNVLAAIADHHVDDAAALVVDNHTGAILAYAGSPDYFATDALGSNDGVQMLRQPGSSLKPFTYELALERHTITTTTILPDVPTTFALPGGKVYQPADYSGHFSGPVLPRIALANSLNVPAVRVLSQTGVSRLLDRLHALGFAHLDKAPSFYGLGLTLGGGEVSLWELAHAYSIAARNGDDIPLHLTAEPSNVNGRVGDAHVWSYVTDVLHDPYARAQSFGLRSVLRMPFDTAVKTGTSSDFRDTWTVGYTRDYTVAVWAGNFDGSAMRGVSGVTGAGPIWSRIMLHLHERNEPQPFDRPQGYVATTVCTITGHAPDNRCPTRTSEYVLPRDIAQVRRVIPAALSHTYDTWLTEHPDIVAGTMHIAYPQSGALFYYHPHVSALQRSEEQLALRAADAETAVRWSVDGTPVALDAEGRAFWPLRPGRHIIDAVAGSKHDRVTITVVGVPPPQRPGFTRDT